MELDVVFRNKEGQKLVGVLSTPNVEKGKFYPAVILCHGFNVHKNLFFFPELAQALVKEGIAVLRFDCRGCGDSEGKYHPTYLEMKEDILAATKYLMSNEDIEFIGVAGHSMGGTASILAGVASEDISAVATFGAVADVLKTVEEKRKDALKEDDHYVWEGKYGTFLLSESFFSEAKIIDMYKEISQLKKPLLLVHGTDDSKINVDQGIRLFLEANMPKSFKRISDSDHWFEGFYPALIESTVSFFKKYLLEKSE